MATSMTEPVAVDPYPDVLSPEGWLDEPALRLYETLLPQLEARQDETRLNPEDRPALMRYCHLASLYATLSQQLTGPQDLHQQRRLGNGAIRDTVLTPLAKCLFDCGRQMRQLEFSLALTAGDRASILNREFMLAQETPEATEDGE